MTEVVLVDKLDNEVGKMEKMEAHEKGLLHRAFSIFIFNDNGEMLLQQRAMEKYHCGGLWTNACCSHPMPGEEIMVAAERRLQEELGIVAAIEKIFHFTYSAKFDNGLTEHEYDHVFAGIYNGAIYPNVSEVSMVTFEKMDQLQEQLKTNPTIFTPWFHIAFPKIEDWWQQSFSRKKNSP